jgi:uncharacterized protein (TIGR00288 family)
MAFSDEPLIAVFVDFENLALGVRDMKGKGNFRVDIILKRLLEKGRIVFKRAYCDWSNYREDVREFHQHGIELVDIPRSKMSGKNSADIHMVVDALDICYAKSHIDVFALLTGDSDFSPLVSKLKENNKRVIGCGVKQSTSNLLIANCDEFIYYDDLVRMQAKGTDKRQRGQQRRKATPTKPEGVRVEEVKVEEVIKPGEVEPRAKPRKASEPVEADVEPKSERKPEAMDNLLEILESLSQDYDEIWGSMVKQTIRRVYPGFNEAYFGYRNFAELLEHAADEGYVGLEFDERRGNYRVRLLD